MISPGCFVQIDKALHLVLAVVPEEKRILVLEAEPLRLRELNPVEYLLVAEDREYQDQLAKSAGLKEGGQPTTSSDRRGRPGSGT